MNERLKNIIWLVVILAAFTIFSTARGGTSTTLDFGDDKLTVNAPENYTYVVGYDEISSVELVDQFEPGTMVSGGETRKYQWGTWKNEFWGEYTLCVSKQIDNALLISRSDGELLVLNYESDKTTETLLDLFHDLLADRKDR